jgi:DIL domain
MYWTACEMFNRILQRRKYLCRSRALHIGLNLGVLEEWISGTVGVGLPREVGGHFKVVRELVGWLQVCKPLSFFFHEIIGCVQCLSSIDQFANLVATVQTFRRLNPLQMRRAVREYRYEVGESKMTEECSQYLAQLQKDWERQRVKLGVEALKKEVSNDYL